MPLSTSATEAGAYGVLAVTGDLDLVTAPQLTRAAGELIAAGRRDVVIDASGLSFCDSSGITAFVAIATRLEDSGGRLAIAGATAIVRRILEISGLIEALVVTATVEEAAAELAGT
ncbi:STAS domain-containing protein [Hamadaea tsunoensis]|uniref:STAS domain-containing protein n=1 Tax=Hamadaea tsunoensis TaxID=53368 RepID=UPI00042244B9|nr:STAS domain-containing protein [Hamadaea tsunoensis]